VESLLPKPASDILELDEWWDFAYQRANQRWLWIALCRRTRQFVAFVNGDRSAATADDCGKPSRPLFAAVAPTQFGLKASA
jgi:hypothetical protein